MVQMEKDIKENILFKEAFPENSLEKIHIPEAAPEERAIPGEQGSMGKEPMAGRTEDVRETLVTGPGSMAMKFSIPSEMIPGKGCLIWIRRLMKARSPRVRLGENNHPVLEEVLQRVHSAEFQQAVR